MNGPPDLGLDLLGIEAGTSVATPTLNLRVGLRRLDGGPVQCVLLTTTVTITPDRLTWTRAGATVPTFRGGTELTLALPRGPDPAAAGHAVGDGDVQLGLAFDGTVFYRAEDGDRHARQVPWRHETIALMPAGAWRDLMARPARRDDRPGTGTLREEEPTA